MKVIRGKHDRSTMISTERVWLRNEMLDGTFVDYVMSGTCAHELCSGLWSTLCSDRRSFTSYRRGHFLGFCCCFCSCFLLRSSLAIVNFFVAIVLHLSQGELSQQTGMICTGHMHYILTFKCVPLVCVIDTIFPAHPSKKC